MPRLLQSACLAGLVISAAPVASISAPDGFSRSGKYQYGRCANTVVPDYLRANYTTSSVGDLPLNIKLWMHVVADTEFNAPDQQSLDDQASLSSDLTAPLVTDLDILQVSVLNDAFNPHGFNFTFFGKSETFNLSVASLPYQDFVTAFVPQQRNGDYLDLNLFIVSGLWFNGVQDANGTRHPSLLGVSTWPVPTNEDLDPYGDSCVIDASTLPDENTSDDPGSPRFASGMTAVHQVGHWLGLLHPFQGDDLDLSGNEEKDGCTEPNDFVPDTVPQRSQTDGCPAYKSSCGNVQVLDNIHNYMDLSDDECLTEFTPGQATRMHAIYKTLRVGHQRAPAVMPTPSSALSPSATPTDSVASRGPIALPPITSMSTNTQAGLFLLTVMMASLSYFV